MGLVQENFTNIISINWRKKKKLLDIIIQITAKKSGCENDNSPENSIARRQFGFLSGSNDVAL